MARDAIRIDNLLIDCVVGVYPHERQVPQPLRVDVEMRCDTEQAGAAERLGRTIDYAALAAQIAFLLQSSRFSLLETAAHALARTLLSAPGPGERRARVESLRLRLTKPDALLGNGIPSLEIERDAPWAVLRHEAQEWGQVDVIAETREAGIYRLNVAAGATIPLHIHRQMRESEMVLSDGLICQGRPVPAGTVHRWPLGAAHGYQNPTDRVQTILCVDCPPFIEADEIKVTGEPAVVAPELPFLAARAG